MDVSKPVTLKPESDFNMEKIFRAVLVNIFIISMSAYLNWTFFQWFVKYIDSCLKLFKVNYTSSATCDTSVTGCHVPPIFILMWNVLSNILVLFKSYGINCVLSATGLCCAQCWLPPGLPWIIWNCPACTQILKSECTHPSIVHGTGTAGIPFKFFIIVSPGSGTDSARWKCLDNWPGQPPAEQSRKLIRHRGAQCQHRTRHIWYPLSGGPQP